MTTFCSRFSFCLSFLSFFLFFILFYFFFELQLQGMVGIAAYYQQLYVLASEGSLFAVGASNWIQFTLSLKKGER